MKGWKAILPEMDEEYLQGSLIVALCCSVCDCHSNLIQHANAIWPFLFLE
jgi:hypothetical protein